MLHKRTRRLLVAELKRTEVIATAAVPIPGDLPRQRTVVDLRHDERRIGQSLTAVRAGWIFAGLFFTEKRLQTLLRLLTAVTDRSFVYAPAVVFVTLGINVPTLFADLLSAMWAGEHFLVAGLDRLHHRRDCFDGGFLRRMAAADADPAGTLFANVLGRVLRLHTHIFFTGQATELLLELANFFDLIAVAHDAMRLEQIRRYQAVLEVEGDTYEATTAHGFMIRKRPEVQMLSDAMRHAHALLGELMITPATALRLGQGEKPEDNPFKALLDL